MKKIIIEIEEDVIKGLNDYLVSKKIAQSIGGIGDMFINKLLIKLQDNEKVWKCAFKDKRKGS